MRAISQEQSSSAAPATSAFLSTYAQDAPGPWQNLTDESGPFPTLTVRVSTRPAAVCPGPTTRVTAAVSSQPAEQRSPPRAPHSH